MERAYVTIRFKEITLQNLRIAMNQPTENLTGSTLTVGTDDVCSVNEHAIQLVTVSPNCGTRTITINRAVTLTDIDYNMMRTEETELEVEFEILKDSDGLLFTIIDS
jgi:hypothetical protein